jgi:hypothetical protein
MANYRVSMNTNNYNNKTTEDKANEKKYVYQLRLFTLKIDIQNISVDLQTAFAEETHLAEGATERRQVTYFPSRNTNADCFEGRGTIFSATKDIFKKRCIEVTTPDIQCLQI